MTGSVKDGWVRVYDAQTGEEREVGKGHHGPVRSCALERADGKLIALALQVHCISYSPDGEMYASGSEDGAFSLLLQSEGARANSPRREGTIRLWQTAPKSYGLWR